MALALVGTSAEAYGGDGSAGPDPIYPAGYTAIAGHTAVIIVYGRGGIVIATPAGWTPAGARTSAMGIGIAAFVKVLAASEALPHVSVSDANGSLARTRIYSGGDATTPLDAAGVGSEVAPSNPWQPTGITTVTAGAMVIAMVCSWDGGNVPTLDTANGYTNLVAGSHPNTGQGMGYAAANLLAGAAGAQVAPSFGNVSYNAGLVIALRPSGGAPPANDPTRRASQGNAMTRTVQGNGGYRVLQGSPAA